MTSILPIYFHIKGKLENSQELKNFFYHGWLHTKSFYDAVCYLGRLEDVDDEDFKNLKISALYHDTGYTTGNEDNHEYQSAAIAQKELPSLGVDEQSVQQICRLIVSTAPGVRPAGILEEIMHDADYEYIGRDYYPYVSELLRREKSILHSVWRREQISFLEKHHFITSSAMKLFDNQKDINYRTLLEQDK